MAADDNGIDDGAAQGDLGVVARNGFVQRCQDFCIFSADLQRQQVFQTVAEQLPVGQPLQNGFRIARLPDHLAQQPYR